MRTVCGLDVHKDSVFLCILHDSGEIIEKVFGVLTHQLLDMRRMMQSHGVSEGTWIAAEACSFDNHQKISMLLYFCLKTVCAYKF